MPKINFADLDQLIESEEEFTDRREKVRKKEAKSRFKELKIEETHE